MVRQLLDSGEDVVGLIRPGASRLRLAGAAKGLRIIEGDIADNAALGSNLASYKPERCIHLAWFAEPGKYLDAPENLDSLRVSLGLIEQLARFDCRHVVAVGTCAEYDIGPHKLTEDAPTRPSTLYAAAKLAFSLVAAKRLAQLGVGMGWARLFYLYGPYEDERRLVPAAINALLAGREFPCTPGKQVRDYLHVDDVASAITSLSRRCLSGDFNVCSGEPVTIATLMETVGDLLGRPDLVRLGVLPYRDWEPMFVCGDNRRLLTDTDWSPRYGLRDGLNSTIEWWRGAR